MPSHNHVTLIGRLTREPELRYSQGGLAVTKFSIAVDRKFKDARTGEKVTDFFDCSAFRQTAEFIGEHITKGRLVCVDGRIEINTSEKDGQKRYFTNIIAESVEALDSPRDGEAAPQRQAPQQAQQQSQNRPQAQRPPAQQRPAQRQAAPADDFDDSDPFADE